MLIGGAAENVDVDAGRWSVCGVGCNIGYKGMKGSGVAGELMIGE